MNAGKPQKQAVAIAYSVAKKSKKVYSGSKAESSRKKHFNLK